MSHDALIGLIRQDFDALSDASGSRFSSALLINIVRQTREGMETFCENQILKPPQVAMIHTVRLGDGLRNNDGFRKHWVLTDLKEN